MGPAGVRRSDTPAEAEPVSPAGAAFITGGSSGIGLALAYELAGAGHDLALFARGRERLEDALNALKLQFPERRVEVFPVDVSDGVRCRAAVMLAMAQLGTPAWVVANAGLSCPGLFLEQPISDHEQQVGTNYMGSLYFAHAVAPAMAHAGCGRIVFVASGAAIFGIYGYAAYAPSKFAVRGLAEVLRVELAPHGVGVTLCMPPDTDTPQLAAENRTKPAATKEITSGGGLWAPKDVARLIVKGARQNKFLIAPSAMLTTLSATHSLIGPILRFYQARVLGARK